MKHLKEFETEAAFENAKSSLESPCIALTEDDTEIHIVYNEPLPFELVDLGLPSGTKWASCNLGAKTPYEYGDYYQWGSIDPNTNTVCDWEHAPFNNSLDHYSSSYFEDNVSNWVDDNNVLKSEYDAAYKATNGKAHIPTKAQWEELLANTTQEFIDEVEVTKFTASNGNSIFFPASGYRENTDVSIAGSAHVWSSSLDPDSPEYAFHLYLSSSSCEMDNWYYRYNGMVVRPVSK